MELGELCRFAADYYMVTHTEDRTDGLKRSLLDWGPECMGWLVTFLTTAQ